jgi:hypothetical protein
VKETISVRFVLDASQHRLMKMKAAEQGVTIIEYMTELIRRDVGGPKPPPAK